MADRFDNSILCFDKPYGWTSFDLVGKVRNMLRKKSGRKFKIGHAGTLDPLATGVMLLCTGKTTKQIDSLHALDKEYVALIRLGETTPSYDRETQVNQQFPFEHITAEMVKEALKKFVGEIDQIPPLFSAKQIDGKRAYELARKGSDKELKPSRVTIYEMELLRLDLPEAEIRVRCGKGTYIRSIARDLGTELKSGAHLAGLRRTRVGDFFIGQAKTLEGLEKELNTIE